MTNRNFTGKDFLSNYKPSYSTDDIEISVYPTKRFFSKNTSNKLITRTYNKKNLK